MKAIAIAVSITALFASVQVSATPLSRDQVVAEYTAAAVAGRLPVHGEGYAGSHVDTISTRTRGEVRADLESARQRGELLAGEQYPFAPSAVPGLGRTRDEVRAELDAERRAHPGTTFEGRL